MACRAAFKRANISVQCSPRNQLIRTILPGTCTNWTTRRCQSTSIKPSYDAVVVGAGHNGLVAASYLQRAGLQVCVLERRDVIGGAAVTEEIVPGFKFSRASYVLSLLRPRVLHELELKKHGLVTIRRDPNSYTPIIGDDGASPSKSSSLTLGRNSAENAKQIARFSSKDAESYVKYNHQMERIVTALDPLLDATPVNRSSFGFAQAWRNRDALKALISTGVKLGKDVFPLYEFLTSPASKILNRWFEGDPLKATLSTDSVVGAMISPFQHGSGYVLLHHVMGELDGEKGVWAYVRGGMGAVSESIANSARSVGAEIYTKREVKQIVVDQDRSASGVVLQDGTHIRSKIVLSNATAKVTFVDLVQRDLLPDEFVSAIEAIDYTSPVTKINVAVSRLPNFQTDPNTKDNQPMPHHHGSIHLNCHSMDMIHQAYVDATGGQKRYSSRPLIEMTIPSSLDNTLAPPGSHVVQLFTQYTPYSFADGTGWTEELKNAYADSVFDCIERYAPGFKSSVVGRDILTPPDIERIFGLTGGNIFHGAISLDQLYFCRPSINYSDYCSPVTGLYMCGSGAHPGGGVMGSAGRLAALTALKKRGRK